MHISTPSLNFIGPPVALKRVLQLPEALRSVKMNLGGTMTQRKRLFRALDRLPNLDCLDFKIVVGWNQPDPVLYAGILPFPKLLGCLKSAYIVWPFHDSLLETKNGITGSDHNAPYYRKSWSGALESCGGDGKLEESESLVVPHVGACWSVFGAPDQRNNYQTGTLGFG
jgi:hypothetical protein